MAVLNRNEYKEEYDKYLDSGNTIRTIQATNLTPNAEWGASAAFACQAGTYAPFCNIAVRYYQPKNAVVRQIDTGGGTITVTEKIQVPNDYIQNYNARNIFLVYRGTEIPTAAGRGVNVGIQYGGVATNTISSYNNVWNKRYGSTSFEWWGNGVTSDNQSYWQNRWQNTQIVTGFRYNGVVLTCEILAYSKPDRASEQFNGTWEDYDPERYPYIQSVFTRVCIGDKSSRQEYQQISLSMQIDTPIPMYTIGSTPQPSTSSFYVSSYPKQTNTIRALNYIGAKYLVRGGNVNGYRGSANNQSYQGHFNILDNFCAVYGDESVNPTSFNYSSETFYLMSKEDIARMMSTFGLYWYGGKNTVALGVKTGDLVVDDLLFLPKMDSDGIYRGNYTRGEATKDEPNSKWGDGDDPFGWYGDNGVQDRPGGGGGGGGNNNDYLDKTEPTKPTLTPLGVFNRSYAMSWESIQALSEIIWNADENVFNTLVKGLAMMGENPMNSIVDCRLYPFDVVSYCGGTLASTISLGRYNTGLTGMQLSSATNSLLYLGGCYFPAFTGTFLDKAPYTEAEMFIPYIGIVPIDVQKYLNKYIDVYMSVDYTTGASMVMIMGDGVIYDYHSGTIGVSIPITGDNASALAGGYISSILGAGGSLTSAGISAASGNVGGLVGGVTGAVNNITSGFNVPTQVQSRGSSSSSCQLYAPQYCYMMIYSPEPIEPSTYGSTVGYACEYTATLSSQSGFTICANPNVSNISATDSERNMIKSALERGVYL